MIYIIIVSHGHDEYIEKLLANLDVNCSAYKIIVRDNKNSGSLKELVYSKSGVHYISGGQYGFGHNNNLAAKYVIGNFNVSPDDYFLFLNPDIIIQHQDLIDFSNYVKQKKYRFATICLYRDFNKINHDYSVRHFPKFRDFFLSYAFGVNRTKLIKEEINNDLTVDWCAGSFMLIGVNEFLNVNGFDQKYFMYCEDIDLCYRLNLSGVRLHYAPGFSAIHYAHHDNRSFLSKAFRWHLKSTLRYLIRRGVLNINNYSVVESELTDCKVKSY